MKLNKIIAAILLLPLLASCQKSNQNVGKVVLKNSVDSVSYALGVNISSSLKNSRLEELNFKALARAIQDVYKADSSNIKMTEKEAISYIGLYMKKLEEMLAEKNLEEGRKFLEENKNKEGIMVDTSGLQYKVITEGTGIMPKPEDIVKVHYTGTFIDGTKFDSSLDRGEPVQFKLNQVIKGWTIGLQKMKVGSKYMLYIPSELAYGRNIRPGSPIGPNQTLIFEVELLDVIHQTDTPQNNK